MTMPDFAHLTNGQIFGFLVGIAFAVWLSGVSRAFMSQTVLWTYVAGWLSEWGVKAAIAFGLAVIGNGIPGVVEPNDLVKFIFIPAAITYTGAAVAAIAKNLGLDLSRLPFARNVESVFTTGQVRIAEAPAKK